jgi:AcrR family transcriptional regulator
MSARQTRSTRSTVARIPPGLPVFRRYSLDPVCVMSAANNRIDFIMRRGYRNEMHVSSQEMATRDEDPQELPETGPRARTRRLLVDATMQLMQSGRVPSVTDVAEAAEVSRATAYRYFPTQAALVQAAVDEALGPILEWRSDVPDAEARIEALLAFAYPRLDEYEATLRAALLQAMDQWSRRRAGTLGDEAIIVRGNRRKLLAAALAPMRERIGTAEFDRLRQALSLVFGTEAFVVLKDIWGLDGDDARDVALWSAHALVRAAIAEAKP